MNNFSNLKAKKSLGQNFLKSKKALSDMLAAGAVGENDIVLEAGPGKGFLTEELLKKAGKVIAVEKDDMLVEFLRDKFSADIASGKLELVHGDILDFKPSSYHLPPTTYNLKPSPHNLQPKTFLKTYNLQPTTYKLLANIPYYITGQFLRKFLSGENQPSKMVILLQKEVVKRIMANDGKESILSISVKAYGKPKNIGKVSKENFFPKPKVDSAILLIDNISRDFFACHSRAGGNDKIEPLCVQNLEEKFFEIVKAGFAHKRKLLAGNLSSFFAPRDNSSCHSPSPVLIFRNIQSLKLGRGNPDSRRFNLDPRFHGDDRGNGNGSIECSAIKSNLTKNREDIEKIFETCGIPPKARAEDIKIEQWKCLSATIG